MAPVDGFSGRIRTGLAILVLAALMLPTHPAAAQEENLSLSLDDISPWVDEASPFEVEVRIRNRADEPRTGLQLEVQLLTAVTSRSSLAAAIDGESRAAVASFAQDDLTVNSSRLVTFSSTHEELGSLNVGIYPVSIQLTDRSGSVLELRTAVPVIEGATDTELNAMTVLDLVDPDPPVRLGGGYDPVRLGADEMRASAERLGAIEAIPGVVAIDGASLDAASDLADGALTITNDGDLADLDPRGPTARAASDLLTALAAAASRSTFAHQPYVPIDPGALEASRSSQRIGRQFRRGATAVRAHLGEAPTHSTLLGDLENHTALPDSIDAVIGSNEQIASVDGAPFSPEQFGTSTPLLIGERPLYVTDDRLTELATGEIGELAAAQAIVAETALRWLELPFLAGDRLIVFAPPRDVSSRLLEHVADTFARAPWLRNVLPSDAGDPVGTATPVTSSEPVETLSLAIPAASRSLRAIRSVVPEDAGDVALERIREWETGLLIAERVTSSGVGDEVLADAIRGDIDAHLARIRAPEGRRITLTSRSGRIPIVVENGNDFPVEVVVHLEGRRLLFPDGRDVDVRLEPGGGTVDVAVEVFGQGSFPLEVSVLTPTGTVLSTHEVRLRSTRVSRVAFLVVAGAIAFLFLQAWRRGHRVRRLPSVPSDT